MNAIMAQNNNFIEVLENKLALLDAQRLAIVQLLDFERGLPPTLIHPPSGMARPVGRSAAVPEIIASLGDVFTTSDIMTRGRDRNVNSSAIWSVIRSQLSKGALTVVKSGFGQTSSTFKKTTTTLA